MTSYARSMRQVMIEKKAWDRVFSMRDRATAMPERSDLGIRAAVLRGRARRISRAMDRWGEGVADLPGL